MKNVLFVALALAASVAFAQSAPVISGQKSADGKDMVVTSGSGERSGSVEASNPVGDKSPLVTDLDKAEKMGAYKN